MNMLAYTILVFRIWQGRCLSPVIRKSLSPVIRKSLTFPSLEALSLVLVCCFTEKGNFLLRLTKNS